MNVWISYLIDCMADYAPECCFDLTERPARKVSTVAVCYPDMPPLRGNTLYLCLEQLPAAAAQIPESACFVTAADAAAAHLPNRIVLGKRAEQGALLDLLLDGVDRYREWIDRLTALSLRKSSPQDYLDASAHMLVNPLLVQDPSYSLIAISRDASTDDYPFFDFDGTLRPLPEFLLHARWDMTLVGRYIYDDEGRGVIAEQDGKLQIFYNILSDGVLCANVTCAVSRTALTQGILDLLYDLCRYLRHSLNLPKLRLAPGSIAGFALEQLLQFKDPDPLVSMLAPKADWAFVVGTLNLSVSGGRATTCMLQIQEMLPHSAVCLHDGYIRLILCVSDQETDAVYYQYQHQRLETLAAALESQFGLSYSMSDLLGVPFGLQQSARALELSLSNTAPPAGADASRLRFYGKVATDDILDSFFDDDMLEHYLAPEIAAIHRSDLQQGQNNCQILYYYLLMGKSLASTSQALHMHRSTIVYRLNRMKETYNLLLDEPERNQHYLLCCRACLLRGSRPDGLR